MVHTRAVVKGESPPGASGRRRTDESVNGSDDGSRPPGAPLAPHASFKRKFHSGMQPRHERQKLPVLGLRWTAGEIERSRPRRARDGTADPWRLIVIGGRSAEAGPPPSPCRSGIPRGSRGVPPRGRPGCAARGMRGAKSRNESGAARMGAAPLEVPPGSGLEFRGDLRRHARGSGDVELRVANFALGDEVPIVAEIPSRDADRVALEAIGRPRVVFLE